MLAIEVAFLTGRYVATAYNRRTEGEWPPHPARLFSALAAAHFAADDSSMPSLSEERAILEWLEQQGAPSIVASGATSREVVTVFVPVNDSALTDVDEEANRLEKARDTLAALEVSGDGTRLKRHAAAFRAADAAFKKALVRAIAIPSKPLNPRFGQRVLPDHRPRQPRTFPSVTPDDPRVTYIWTEATASEEGRRVLDGLLGRVVRLGHSSSLISARLVEHAGPVTLRPDVDGETTLRVVQAGQLAALERAFELHREIAPRVMPAVPHAYVAASDTAAERTATSAFSAEWLVLRRVGGRSFPMTATASIARALRKTLMSYADEPIAETLSGHTLDQRPSQQPHLAIVPLPFVGHEHASGDLLGVALVLPQATVATDRRAVYTAVARWEEKYRQEDEDTPAVRLNFGSAGELHLERIQWRSVQASLRASVWYGPAHIWCSVTPVALDRNPGNLRSRDPRKLLEATDEAREILCTACERIDLPRPAYVEILPASPWVGARRARDYPPFPEDRSRGQRVLTHARIHFAQRVMGPVLLGAGRYVGLGLFRPAASR